MTPDEAREILKVIDESSRSHVARRHESMELVLDNADRVIANIAQLNTIVDAGQLSETLDVLKRLAEENPT